MMGARLFVGAKPSQITAFWGFQANYHQSVTFLVARGAQDAIDPHL
jgi:hypothetical protein